MGKDHLIRIFSVVKFSFFAFSIGVMITIVALVDYWMNDPVLLGRFFYIIFGMLVIIAALLAVVIKQRILPDVIHHINPHLVRPVIVAAILIGEMIFLLFVRFAMQRYSYLGLNWVRKGIFLACVGVGTGAGSHFLIILWNFILKNCRRIKAIISPSRLSPNQQKALYGLRSVGNFVSLYVSGIKNIFDSIFKWIQTLLKPVTPSLKMQEISNLILKIFIVILPLAMTTGLIWIFFKEPLSDLSLSKIGTFNDEIGYWHMSLTFKEVGFKGGYYNLQEMPAKISQIPFGPHGPMYPIIYGSLAKLFGWQQYSAVYYNVFFITLALILFLRVSPLSTQQLSLLIIGLLSFWPMWLFTPSNMQESLHQTFAILFAVLFYRYHQDNPPSRILQISIFTLIILASLVRWTWAILFFPFFLYKVNDTSFARILKALIIGGIFTVLMYYIFLNMASPYPYNQLAKDIYTSGVSLLPLINTLKDKVVNNLHVFFSLPPQEEKISRLLRIQLLITLCLYIVDFSKQCYQKKAFTILHPITLHIINLGFPLFAVFLQGQFLHYNSFRFLSPHLLLSILIMLLMFPKNKKILYFLLFTNMLFIGTFSTSFREIRSYSFNQEPNPKEILNFKQEIDGVVAYDPDAPSRWCNVMGVTIHLYRTSLADLPAGVGISFHTHFTPPLKSKYWLVENEMIQEFLDETQGYNELILLKEFPQGNLYLNQSAECVDD